MTLARCERCASYRPFEELYQEGTAGGFTRLEDRYWCVDLRACERRERDGVGGSKVALPYDRRQHRAGAWDCPKQVRDRLKKEPVWRQNCALMATSSGDPWVYPGTMRDLGPSVEDFRQEFSGLPGPDPVQWNDNLFTGDGPGGVLQVPDMDPARIEEIREAWEERHQGHRRRLAPVRQLEGRYQIYMRYLDDSIRQAICASVIPEKKA